MKKHLTFALLMLSITAFAQKEYYVGKWDMEIFNTPNGDVKLPMEIMLTGDSFSGTVMNPEGEAIAMDKLDYTEESLTVYFSIGGYDVNIVFNKVDDANMKGVLMNMLDVKAKRIQEDYFAGKWNLTVFDTPNGDAQMLATLNREEGKLMGKLSAEGMDEEIQITEIEEDKSSIKMYFTAQGYDVWLLLEKGSGNEMQGNMLDMFKAKAVKVLE